MASMGLNISKFIPTPKPEEAYNAMFGLAAEQVRLISLELLDPFGDQPFRSYDEEALDELAASIQQHGLLTPIIVQQLPEQRYRILAGHNRVKAVQRLGQEKINAIVKECDDDQTTLIMLETNLAQRKELLPSELAFAYKMQMETLKHQGKRDDSTSAQFEPKLSSETVAAQMNTSRAQVQRYIRLTYLIKPFLDMTDERRLAVNAGVALSYLAADEQQLVLDFILQNKKSISIEIAESLKKLSAAGDLIEELLPEIFGAATKEKTEKPPKPAVIRVSIPYDRYSRYFQDMGPKEIAQRIDQIIEEWLEKHRLLDEPQTEE